MDEIEDVFPITVDNLAFCNLKNKIMGLKEKVYQHYLSVLDDKIGILQNNLAQLAESLESETKSTAGDKYETARAFVHIEQENLKVQLVALLEQKAALASIRIDVVADCITKGSLVCTNKGYFFLSIAQGKAIIDDKVIFALSPFSPLGRLLLGLKVGEMTSLNKNEYTIIRID